MASYIVTRALRWVIGILVILFVTYAMMYYGGGDPIRLMYSNLNEGSISVDPSQLEAVRKQYGLDQPFLVQFWHYLVHLTQGDMGKSFIQKRPVSDMIVARLPVSLQIGLAATLMIALIGIPLGVVAALRHNSWLDSAIVVVLSLCRAVPVFVTAPLLLLLLVVGLHVMDVPVGWKGLFNSQVILPIIVIAVEPLLIVVRQTRAAMLEILADDYVRTARAKGLPPHQIITRHMLRPVLAPVITTLGLVMISLLNGAVFVELIFNIPGFGNLSIQALQQVDYPVIMGTVLVGALLVMVSNLLVDLIYPVLDPRVTSVH
jgi:ABC-type dipeptide/oligopeptide/nickel transport system permease component